MGVEETMVAWLRSVSARPIRRAALFYSLTSPMASSRDGHRLEIARLWT